MGGTPRNLARNEPVQAADAPRNQPDSIFTDVTTTLDATFPAEQYQHSTAVTCPDPAMPKETISNGEVWKRKDSLDQTRQSGNFNVLLDFDKTDSVYWESTEATATCTVQLPTSIEDNDIGRIFYLFSAEPLSATRPITVIAESAQVINYNAPDADVSFTDPGLLGIAIVALGYEEDGTTLKYLAWGLSPSPGGGAAPPAQTLTQGYAEAINIAATAIPGGGSITVTQDSQTFTDNSYFTLNTTTGEWTILYDGVLDVSYDVTVEMPASGTRDWFAASLEHDTGSGFVYVQGTYRKQYMRQSGYGGSVSIHKRLSVSNGDKVRAIVVDFSVTNVSLVSTGCTGILRKPPELI